MVLVEVGGVGVEFPYEPYDCQKDYMDKVVQALDMKCDAALESPTGTGKTLSLLCSTLGWLQKKKMGLTHSSTISKLITELDGTQSKVPSITASHILPRVFYCSRTHSQLAQVVRELNKTVYKTIPTAVLGSREQLCIHETISKETDNQMKGAMCRSAVSKRTCHYFNNWDKTKLDALEKIYNNSGNVLDIEELVSIAKNNRHCPFFRSRQMHEKAELILLPYNYLISPHLRNIHKIDLLNSVIIFDEAHNLESVCEECVSVELSTTDVTMCIRELKKAIELYNDELELLRAESDMTEVGFSGVTDKTKEKKPKFEVGTAAYVLNMLFELEKYIDEGYECTGQTFEKFPGKVFPGEHLVTIMEKAQFSADKSAEIIELLQKAADFLSEQVESGGSSALGQKEKGAYLQKLQSFLGVIYSSHAADFVVSNAQPSQSKYAAMSTKFIAKDFKLYMVKDGKDEDTKTVVKYWCFAAGLAMKALKARGVRSIIVTSGTLAPLPNFMSNIGLDFGCTLENGHAAKGDQVFTGVVRALGGTNLIGTFQNRSTEAYQKAIGEAIVRVAESTPQGKIGSLEKLTRRDTITSPQATAISLFAVLVYQCLGSTIHHPEIQTRVIGNLLGFMLGTASYMDPCVLVFFSSYSMMDQLVTRFKRSTTGETLTLWDRMNRAKTLVVEPRNKMHLPSARLEFSHGVLSEKGSMFFAVCRGKVSEGIDFADAESRAVVVVGVPFPPVADPRIVMKRLHLDEIRRTDKSAQTSDAWYKTEGMRAVNQAIGRVLRHVNDFGCIVLLDSRFGSENSQQFPHWLRSSIKTYDDFEQLHRVLVRFFRERDFQIKASYESMENLLMQKTAGGERRAKKRSRIQIQHEGLRLDLSQIDSPLNQSQKNILSIGQLSEKVEEEYHKAEEESRTLEKPQLSKTFGAIASTSTSGPQTQETQRKKLKLKRRAAFDFEEDKNPIAAENVENGETDGYAEAMKLSVKEVGEMAKSSGHLAAMKQLVASARAGGDAATIALGVFAKEVLPHHPRLFLGAAIFLTDEAQKKKLMQIAMENGVRVP